MKNKKIQMDKNPAYIKAITALKIEKKINENTFRNQSYAYNKKSTYIFQ